MKKTILRQIVSKVVLSMIVLFPLCASGQLSYVSNVSLKADHNYPEHKALAISANGDMYFSINAKQLSVLNSSNMTTDIVNTINSVRAGILVKVDSNSNVIWSNMVAGDAVSAKNSQVTLVREVGDFIYVVGGVTTNVKTPSPINVFGIALQSQGLMDYYIAKLSSTTGQAIWVKTYGNVRDWEMFMRLDADAQGNIYAAGILGNTLAEPLELGSLQLTATGNWGEDYFVVKFNSNGDIVWAKNVGSKFRENGDDFGLSLDKNGDVLLAITSNDKSRSNLTAESEIKREYVVGTTTYYLYPEDKKSDAMLVKLASADGAVKWSRFFTGPGDQRLLIATALSGAADVVVYGTADNNIVVQGSAGLEEKTITHPLNSVSTSFMMAFDANGNYLWTTSPQGEVNIIDVRPDNNNGFYIGGSFNTYAALNPEIILNATEGNVKEGLLAMYTSTGTCSWGKTVKGVGGQIVKQIAINGSKMAISGEKVSDAMFPFYETPIPFEVNAVPFRWYILSYNITSTASGFGDVTKLGTDVKFNNPVIGGVLNLKLDISKSSSQSVQIVDISGRVMLEKVIVAENSTMNVSSLKAGVYLIKITDKNGNSNYTDKLIVR